VLVREQKAYLNLFTLVNVYRKARKKKKEPISTFSMYISIDSKKKNKKVNTVFFLVCYTYQAF